MLSRQDIEKLRKRLRIRDDRLAVIFEALSDPTRFGIFKLLVGCRDVCVTDVAAIFKISVPAASQQLKILERAGMIRRQRMGQMVCYVIRKDDSLVRRILKFII